VSYVKTAQRAVLRWAKFLPNWMPLRDRYWSAAKGGIALRAAPELIGEIAKDPTFSKEFGGDSHA